MLIISAVLSWAGGQKAAEKVKLVDIRWSEKTVDVLVPEIASKFMAQNPNIEVQLLLFAHPDTINKIRTTLATGGDIDAFTLGNTDTPEFLSKGYCLEFMPAGFGKKTMQEVVDMWEPNSIAVTGGVWNGKYYGVPYELSNYAAWINTKFMSEAGLNPKTDLPKDWDQFAEVCKKLTVEKGGVRVRNGFSINAKTGLFFNFVYNAFIEQQGLSWSTEESWLKSLDDPKAVTALGTLTDLATKHKVWDPGLVTDEREGFGNGLSATFLTGGTWYWGVLEAYSTPKEDVTPFPYPRFKGGKDIGGPGYGGCTFVAKSSKNPLWAWKWVDFQGSFPNEWMKRGKAYQPRLTLDQSLAKQYVPTSEVFVAEFKKASTTLSSVHFNEISDALGAFVSRVIFEGMPVEKSIEILKKDGKTIFGK
jgi:ABC-type glycerol-3-phosphate transport system substrate-binding protein